MMLLDTNVVSELIRPTPDPVVFQFVAHQVIDTLFIPVPVIAEIRYGVRRLPNGRRRRELDQAFEGFLQASFSGRILDFDEACATGYATARAVRTAAGRPVMPLDAMIGGMALAHRATLITRNVPDFDGYGLTLVNPWGSP